MQLKTLKRREYKGMYLHMKTQMKKILSVANYSIRRITL